MENKILKTLARLIYLPIYLITIVIMVLIGIIQIIFWIPQVIITGNLCGIILNTVGDWVSDTIIGPLWEYCDFTIPCFHCDDDGDYDDFFK